jgi:putative Holliday junction resolvase
MSDPSQLLASPLKTASHANETEIVSEIVKVVKEHQVVAIVVGMPFHMNYTMSKRGIEVQVFIETLRSACNVPVYSWDERWTTVSAQRSLRARGVSPSKNRRGIDQIAAAYILQSYLDRLCHLRSAGENSLLSNEGSQ